MFRVRTEMLVKYGHFNDVLENSRQLNDLAKKNGWQESSFWVALSGQDNTFVVETNFDSMTSYDRESEATYTDADYMKLIRANIDHIVEGTVVTEMFQEAVTIA